MGSAILCILVPGFVPTEPSKEQLVLSVRVNTGFGGPLSLDGSRWGSKAWYVNYSKQNGDAFDGYSLVSQINYMFPLYYREYYKQHMKHPTRARHYVLPPLSTNALKGDIVPLLGFLYRAKGSEFYWVPHKDLPDGLTAPARDSLFVPLQRYEKGALCFGDDGSYLVCPKIVPGKEPKDGHTATLVYTDNLAAVYGSKSTGTVRAGDVVVLPNEGGYVVRRIIPAGPRGGALGWVELSSMALSADDVKKAGKPVVRLEPVK